VKVNQAILVRHNQIRGEIVIMPSVKCDNCGHSVEIEDATKKYKTPLFIIFLSAVILTYENLVTNPSFIITILGFLSGTAGLIWLLTARLSSIKVIKKE
jgi:hypothetical protein